MENLNEEALVKEKEELYEDVLEDIETLYSYLKGTLHNCTRKKDFENLKKNLSYMNHYTYE